MARNRNSSLLGIDISSTAVRIVRVDGIDADGFAKVSAVGYTPLKEGAVSGGRIRSTVAVAAAIQNELKKMKCARVPAVLGATSLDAGLSRIALPSEIPASKRVAVLATNNNRVASAISTGESVMATSLVRSDVTSDGTDVAALNVAATYNSELDTLLEVARLAKLNLFSVDLSVAATVRAAVRDIPDSNEVTAIVDVGASTTRVIVREGLHIRNVRSIPSGGDDITKGLAAALKCGFDEAEEKKFELSVGSKTAPVSVGYGDAHEEMDDSYIDALANQSSAQSAVDASTDLLIDQIAQAVTISDKKGQITQVSLCGGSLLLTGFSDRLERRLGIPVRVGQPWAKVTRNKNTEHVFSGSDPAPRIMLALTTAIGLATPHFEAPSGKKAAKKAAKTSETMQPAATQFDFLELAKNVATPKIKRSRRIAAAFGGVAVLIAGFGMFLSSAANQTTAEAERVSDMATRERVGIADFVGGDPRIPDQVAIRTAEFDSATKWSTDINAVKDVMFGALSEDMTLNSVVVQPSESENVDRQVTVEVSVSSLDQIDGWQAAIEQVVGLTIAPAGLSTDASAGTAQLVVLLDDFSYRPQQLINIEEGS